MINELMVDVLANLVMRHRRIPISSAADILGLNPNEVYGLAKALSKREEFEVFEKSVCFLKPSGQDSYRVRLRSHYLEKYAIGRLASAQLNAGDHVVVEAGSTMTILAQHLSQVKNIRISTNSHSVASLIISAEEAADIHLLGGQLMKEGHGTLGPVALEAVRQLDADWGVICPVGLCADGELLYYIEEEAEFARAVMASCKRTMVLCTSVKLGVPSCFSAGKCADADLLIVDSGAEQSILATLRGHGVDHIEIADVDAEVSSEIVVLDI